MYPLAIQLTIAWKKGLRRQTWNLIRVIQQTGPFAFSSCFDAVAENFLSILNFPAFPTSRSEDVRCKYAFLLPTCPQNCVTSFLLASLSTKIDAKDIFFSYNCISLHGKFKYFRFISRKIVAIIVDILICKDRTRVTEVTVREEKSHVLHRSLNSPALMVRVFTAQLICPAKRFRRVATYSSMTYFFQMLPTIVQELETG